jgi:deazaflavin-dependent oxidoreductase (nitroreductase family)
MTGTRRSPSPLVRLSHVAVGTLLTSRPGTRLHLAVHRASRGRLVHTVAGLRVVVLTTTGRRSGRRIDAPLVALADGDSWVIVASNGGRDDPPNWLLNLEADPRATLWTAGRAREVVARRATPGERHRLWPAIVSRYGGYETYRRRTAREVPLVLLEPGSQEEAGPDQRAGAG